MITIYTTVKMSSILPHNAGMSITEYSVVVKELQLEKCTTFQLTWKNRNNTSIY